MMRRHPKKKICKTEAHNQVVFDPNRKLVVYAPFVVYDNSRRRLVMSYTMLKNPLKDKNYDAFSLEGASLRFIRERCEGLRFDEQKAKQE